MLGSVHGPVCAHLCSQGLLHLLGTDRFCCGCIHSCKTASVTLSADAQAQPRTAGARTAGVGTGATSLRQASVASSAVVEAASASFSGTTSRPAASASAFFSLAFLRPLPTTFRVFFCQDKPFDTIGSIYSKHIWIWIRPFGHASCPRLGNAPPCTSRPASVALTRSISTGSKETMSKSPSKSPDAEQPFIKCLQTQASCWLAKKVLWLRRKGSDKPGAQYSWKRWVPMERKAQEPMRWRARGEYLEWVCVAEVVNTSVVLPGVVNTSWWLVFLDVLFWGGEDLC